MSRLKRLHRLDVFAVTFATGAAVALGALLAGQADVAGISAGVGLAALILLLFVPDADSDDLEALMRATREEIPDYVPAEWVSEP